MRSYKHTKYPDLARMFQNQKRQAKRNIPAKRRKRKRKSPFIRKQAIKKNG